MTLFIVEAEKGIWDGWHWWIHGIYQTPIEAQESKERLIADCKVKCEKPCPIPGILLDEYGDPTNLEKKDQNTYYIWCNEISDAKSFKGAKVIVYETGKLYEEHRKHQTE